MLIFDETYKKIWFNKWDRGKYKKNDEKKENLKMHHEIGCKGDRWK